MTQLTPDALIAWFSLLVLLGGNLVAGIVFLVRQHELLHRHDGDISDHKKTLTDHGQRLSDHDRVLAVHDSHLFGRRRDDDKPGLFGSHDH